MRPNQQPEAAHAACELGMDDDSKNFPGVPGWVPAAVVALIAVVVIIFVN